MTKVYFDGGCRPNPGTIETAVVARGKLHHRPAAGHGSSEAAEWQALLDAIAIARALGISDLVLLGDSISVVNRGQHHLAGLEGFDRIRLRHVKRSHNLAGIALGQMRQGRTLAAEKGVIK